MKKQIETVIDIQAGTAEVWRVLMEFQTYPEWNPFIRSIVGDAHPGERLAVQIQPPGKRAIHFSPHVIVVQDRSAFSWLGHLLIPGLFSGVHEFRLQPIGSATRLYHRESFSGILVPLLWAQVAPPTRAGFEAMNQALKARAEALVAASSQG